MTSAKVCRDRDPRRKEECYLSSGRWWFLSSMVASLPYQLWRDVPGRCLQKGPRRSWRIREFIYSGGFWSYKDTNILRRRSPRRNSTGMIRQNNLRPKMRQQFLTLHPITRRKLQINEISSLSQIFCQRPTSHSLYYLILISLPP